MYTNYCVYKEDVTNSDPATHRIAPKPPCRSFCVQVADICANDPDFVNLCYNIQCPPTRTNALRSYRRWISCRFWYWLFNAVHSKPYNVAIHNYHNICYLCTLLLGTVSILLWQLLHWTTFSVCCHLDMMNWQRLNSSFMQTVLPYT